jgi:hypothetical protein
VLALVPALVPVVLVLVLVLALVLVRRHAPRRLARARTWAARRAWTAVGRQRAVVRARAVLVLKARVPLPPLPPPLLLPLCRAHQKRRLLRFECRAWCVHCARSRAVLRSPVPDHWPGLLWRLVCALYVSLCRVAVSRVAQARGHRDRNKVAKVKAAKAVGVKDIDAADRAATKVQVRVSSQSCCRLP